MKKFGTALLWLAVFAAAGAALMLVLAELLLPHRMDSAFIPGIAGTGAVPGLLGWVILMCFSALPGARPAPGARFGLAQALWGMCGTVMMMLAGAILPYMAAVYWMLLRILRHLPSHMPNRHDTPLLLTSLLASELLGALWLSWYVHRQGPLVANDGSPQGIAWRPAPARAYGVAALGGLVVLLLAVGEFWLIPPDISKLKDMDLTQLFQGPPVIALLTAMVVIVMAPVIEEVLFRGLAFAGIASKLGTGWAVVITTIIFTALHAPEKLLYLPGFADVAAVALLSCALRLRYRSIRPGIAMHFFYNFGMLLVPALTGGH
jgi:membrane protease YdiL (CAAX protease family)